MLQSELKRQGILDTLGGVLSLGCAIHCLVVPVLTVIWPVVGTSFVADETFHMVLLYGVVPTALISLGLGCRSHRNYKLLWVGALGLGMLTYFTLTEGEVCQHCISEAGMAGLAFWDWSGEVLIHKGGMIVGSLLLCWAHWRNFVACRTTDCDH